MTFMNVCAHVDDHVFQKRLTCANHINYRTCFPCADFDGGFGHKAMPLGYCFKFETQHCLPSV